MRPSLWFGLAALCLFAGAFRTSFSRAEAPRPAPKGATAIHFSQEVTADGLTAEDARQLAYEDAHEKVLAHLAEHHPKLGWTPSREDLTRIGVISPKGEQAGEDPDTKKKFYEVKLQVEIKTEHLQEIAKMARHQRMHDRQVLLAKILGGLVALLVVAAGYLRLEDLTRGYYTTLLRLAAFGTVAAVGAGLWLLA
jgi:hypothetical protein